MWPEVDKVFRLPDGTVTTEPALSSWSGMRPGNLVQQLGSRTLRGEVAVDIIVERSGNSSRFARVGGI